MNRAQIAAGMAGVFFLSALYGFGQQPDSSSTAQTVPRVVKFTGVLSDVAGKPLSGPADVTFSLYKEQSGGEPLWSETQTLEADALGRYTVLLGATRPEGLPVEVFASGEARWLAVQVGKEPEQPRVLLVSVPYALKAEEAEKLGGKRATDFVLAEKLKEEVKTAVAVEVQQVGEKSSEQVASEKGPQPLTGAEGPTDFSGSNSTQIASVTQTGSGKAVHALIQNAASGAQAVRGETNGSGTAVFGHASGTTGGNTGVQGDTLSTQGTGVFGHASAATGTAIGVRGQSDSPNGVGVSAYLPATTGYNYAVYALTRGGQGRGVLAQASATSGPTVGVLGMVSSPSGVAGIFRNTASGKLLTGQVGAGPYTQVFSVDGSGNITASGGVTATTFTGSGSGLTNLSAANLTGPLRVVVDATSPGVIGGYSTNAITGGVHGATISGGGASGNSNLVTDDYGTVGGGINNRAGDASGTTSDKPYATVGGGRQNTASGTDSTVAGGNSNTASGQYSTVGGGFTNTASNVFATVGGGNGNTASGTDATVGGGDNNTASGDNATVPGGVNNAAGGTASFAAGNRAKANDSGSFVWGDWNNFDVTSGGVGNSFTARATGGFRFITALDGAGNATKTVTIAAASGDVSAPGNLSVTGTISGNGSGLTGVTASGLTCTGCVGNTQLGVNYAASASKGGDATNALALGGVGPSGYAPAVNSLSYVDVTGDTMTNTVSTPIISISQGGSGEALKAQSTTNFAVFATSTLGTGIFGKGVGHGVRGDTTDSGSAGVRGINLASSGVAVGIYGSSASSPNAVGVRGIAGASPSGYSLGRQAGVWGDTSGQNIGVLGTTNGSAGGAGVYGWSSAANGIGVGGVADASGAYGVWGASTGGYAGFFSGHVYVTGNLTVGGTFSNPSSRRWKSNIQTLQGALAKVERLRGVSYDWKETGQHQIGVIAEEIAPVLPEVVAFDKNGTDAVGVDYARLTALLIEAVKEQQAEIRQLKSQIARLTAAR